MIIINVTILNIYCRATLYYLKNVFCNILDKFIFQPYDDDKHHYSEHLLQSHSILSEKC